MPAAAGTGAIVSIRDIIRAAYEHRLETESDIKGHLQFMHDTALAAGGKVIELGVRSGNSTAAFLAAAQEHADGWVFSVDIEPTTAPDEWHQSGQWDFCLANDLDAMPLNLVLHKRLLPGCGYADVLFIDTSHAYMHTIRELRAWRPLVRPGGWILMHDTMYDPTPYEVGGIPQPRWPVSVAIAEYCAELHLSWTNRTGYYGMGVIHIPEAEAA